MNTVAKWVMYTASIITLVAAGFEPQGSRSELVVTSVFAMLQALFWQMEEE